MLLEACHRTMLHRCLGTHEISLLPRLTLLYPDQVDRPGQEVRVRERPSGGESRGIDGGWGGGDSQELSRLLLKLGSECEKDRTAMQLRAGMRREG